MTVPPMTAPNLLLRDAALLAAVAPVVALGWGADVALAVGVGAAAGWLNLALWVIAVVTVLGSSPTRAFVPLKLFAGIGLVALLDRWFPGLPALVGFAAPLSAFLGRSLLSHPTPSRVG